MEGTTRPTWRDAWLPAALLAVGTFEMASLHLDGWVAGVAMEGLASALLVLRRRWPLVTATASTLAIMAIPLVGPPMDEPAVPILYLVVAMYTLGRWIRGYLGLAGMAVTLGITFYDYVTVDTREHSWSDVVFVLALAVPPYVVGRIARQLADRAELLERNQELVRREAVRAERDRIARELHDVIAHSVSAMVVQTAAAQDLVRRDPDRAARVLDDVASTGRRALVETGRLLHVIRDDAGELGLDPAPGLRDVPALVEAFRDSGLDVRLEVSEPLPALPPGVDVSAYRIVQEALTNALKHGTGRTAYVRVGATLRELTISTENPVNGSRGAGSGLGLLGMQERVSLLGGRLATFDADGRFRLRVTVPLAGRE